MPVDLSNAWTSVSRIVNITISLVPNAILAIVILVIFPFIGATAKAAVRRFSQRRHRRLSLGVLLGQLTHVTVVVIGFLIALSTVAPSLHAVDLIRMLGIGSVANGFAFQNILQNFLAGILLLIQEPFEIGDWISITGFEGQVEDIQTRATEITTATGQRIVIPNAVLFTNPVVVGHARSAAEGTNRPQAVAQVAGRNS
jgi:small conductance mechanosensitive channel